MKISGQLIGGIVGAAIGFFVGMPQLGFAIGSLAGGLLFPQKGPDGPRLEDLKPQSSEYGRPIPIVYGTVALAGNVIWASDLVEVQSSSGGGKGGAEQTSFSYFANFAVAVCEARSGMTLGRIWAGPEKRLIWDGTTLEGADAGAILRFYDGSETQLADPLIESFEGAGNVPAYRGTCYVVLEHFPVAKDGNRIPFLTIEIGQPGSTAPDDLGIVFVDNIIITPTHYAVFYHGSYEGVVLRSLTDESFFHNRFLTTPSFGAGDALFYDSDRDKFIRVRPNSMDYEILNPSSGSVITRTMSVASGGDPNPSTHVRSGVYHNGVYIFAAAGNDGSHRTTLYVIDPDTGAALHTYTSDLGTGFVGPLLAPSGSQPWVYGFTNTPMVKQYALSSSTASIDLGAPAPITSGDMSEALIDQNTGYIWTVNFVSGTSITVHVNDPATASLIFSETRSAPYLSLAQSPLTYVPGSPAKIIISGEKFLGLDYFFVYNADSPAYISDGQGVYHGISPIGAMAYNPVTSKLTAFRDTGYAANGTSLDPLDIPYLSYYMGGHDISNAGELLSSVLTNLHERAGLTSGQIGVSRLTDETVDGYAIANQTTVRDAIGALMPAYYFDSVESEGIVQFVTRGGAIAATIPNDDVGSFEYGGEPPDALETTRRMENELPRTMNVKYLLAATDYSPAAKESKRLVGASGDEQTLQLPLVLSDTKAQEIAEVNLHGAWVARLTYSFTLPRKYSYLEPTDIVVVYGYTMRLTKTVQQGGIIKCEAVHDDSNIYVPSVIVTETEHNDQSVEITSESILELA